MNPAELFRQAADAFQLAPGDFLFREGDKRDKMYVLLEGEMDIRLGDYVFETAGAGALIGVIALIVLDCQAANASSELFHHMRREIRVLLNKKMEPPLIDWRKSAGGLRHSVGRTRTVIDPSASRSAGRVVAKSSKKVATAKRTRRKA